MDANMLKPAEVCDEMVKVGVKKTNNTFFQTVLLGILAGAFIAIGGVASSVASHGIKDVGTAKFVAGAIFPVGLMLVIICGGELFTGNILIICGVVDKKVSIKAMLKNWVIIYFSNFIGAFIIGFLLYVARTFDLDSGIVGGYAIKVAAAKANLSFGAALASGILCNFIVCLAVWGAAAAKDIAGKVAIIWFSIMAFVVCGFEHSVANMYYFTAGMLSKMEDVYVQASGVSTAKLQHLNFNGIISNMIPVTLGNIIGGAVCVGLIYYAIYKAIPANTNKKDKINIAS